MKPHSHVQYASVPSAILSDGALLTVPLWSVTALTLTEAYHLPPIGSSGMKAIVATHDDTLSLSGVLVGPERFAWKFALESLAETSKRGGALGALSQGKLNGIILVTSLTIRTDIQIQSLQFGMSANKREALDVTISMAYMPLPGSLGKLLDVASVGIGALTDFV